MGWFQSLFGRLLKRIPEWGGEERRQSFRVRCDFEIEVQAPGCSYLARCVDAGPQGLKLKVRGPFVKKILRRSQPIRLRYIEPLYEAELDAVGGTICWVRREGQQLFTLAVSFEDTLDNLKKSWVKPILQKVFKAGSRRNQRRHMRAKCKVAGTAVINGKRQEIKLTDLSTSGARVSSLQPVEVGAAVEVEFENLCLRGIVRRCAPDYGVYRLGLSFSPNDETRQKLVRLVKRLVEVGRIVDPGSA
ncbi:PilZ domain-containing protein [bacterium]|nr:PilZ domain-containing protein [bacterium]